jgi:drug/metabolite transporter (DMT)-like permease
MTRAYSLDRAARVSALGYSGVLFTRALGLVFFGEVPSAVQLVGTLLVIASGVLLSLGESALALLRRTASE